MPRRSLLSNEQRTRLFAVPVDHAVMAKHYVLSADDLVFVRTKRRSVNRLGFAVQLCLLRYPGLGMGPAEQPPEAMIAFVARQLGVRHVDFANYAQRDSVTAGTIMHHSKLPLTTWFWAAYLMATHSNGISALQLQRQLGLGSYRSAWLLCGKLRQSMVAPSRSALAGLVEIDETEMPCRSKNDPVTGGGGRSHQGKMLIVGAVEVLDGGAGPGRIRLNKVSDYSADSLHPFIAGNLAPGAIAKTDGWSVYPGASTVKHDPHVIGKMAAHIVLPWVHRIFSNLKVWALGVYHGLRRKHLQSYLDEFVFRFNRRRTRHAAFRSLLGIAAGHPPLSYNMLISPEAKS